MPRMPLDPIVSLSVAIAESPGSFAFFLGSGVSTDAGVPTGTEVFWLAVADLYRLEQGAEEKPDSEVLSSWLAATGRQALSYSGILELICPDAPTRRDYLAKHFDGVDPGVAHERLAALAALGLVRVFITTNFDRLLEHALQARGIEPVVITSDADLEAAPAREHSRCYVLKPHGDYLQQTFRNTVSELAKLPRAVGRELQEVLNRYGVVVLGYSGVDEAIGQALRSRHSHYGLYWLTRAELGDAARSIVDASGARLIVRPNAAEFLTDLERRLAVFQLQPSGVTPDLANDEAILLCRRTDMVGLRELLRRERREFEVRLDSVVEDGRSTEPNEEIIRDVEAQIRAVLDRRLGTLLPLALHSDELLAEELGHLAEYRSRHSQQSGWAFWAGLTDWTVWCLLHGVGALAVRARRIRSLKPLFAAAFRDSYGHFKPLADSYPGEVGTIIAGVTTPPPEGQKWLAPGWEAMRRTITDSGLVNEKYPELTNSEGEPLRSLVYFDFLHVLALGVGGERALAHWSLYSDCASELAQNIRRDAQLRNEISEAVGIDPADFMSRAPELLRAAHNLARFGDDRPIRILESETPLLD
jgi:hypothetical protein